MLVITLLTAVATKLFQVKIITVTQEAGLPINASPPVRHGMPTFKAEALRLVSNVQQLKRLSLLQYMNS